jgi:hypothetical protein
MAIAVAALGAVAAGLLLGRSREPEPGLVAKAEAARAREVLAAERRRMPRMAVE